MPKPNRLLDPSYLGGAVACFRLACRVGLDELGEVNPRAHVERHIVRVEAQAVRRDLTLADRGVVQLA